MNLEEQSRLSYFKKVADISTHKNVSLVQHVETLQIFVRKELQVYDKGIYLYLMRSRSRYFPRIFECIEDEGTLILIEEYIQGETLEAYVQRRGKLPLPEGRAIMGMICEAVDSLHRLNPPFIHRDLKPSNIVLAKDGVIRIVDFNAARVYEKDQARDTVIIGTRHYAAPEQYGFRQSDVRTDIYALGVLMNYLLTGRYPEEELCPGIAGQIVRKCICFEPEGRFQNVGELARALAGMDPYAAPNRQSAGSWDANRQNTGSRNANRQNTGQWDANRQSANRWNTPAGNADRGFSQKKYRFPFLPPGFRTPALWKMIIACLGYLFAVAVAFFSEWQEKDDIPLKMHGAYRVIVFLICLGWIFLWCNYGNIQRYLIPGKGKGLKLIGLVFYSILIVVVAALALIAIERWLL